MLNKLLMFIVCSFLPLMSWAMSDTALIIIRASVGASCSITPDSQSVDLGTISLNVNNDTIKKNSKDFELTANCPGANAYKYSFYTAETPVDYCVPTGKKALIFCLEDENGNRINLSTDQAAKQYSGTLNNDNDTRKFTIVPQLHGDEKLETGEYTGSLYVRVTVD